MSLSLAEFVRREITHWSTATITLLVLVLGLLPEKWVNLLSLTQQGVAAGQWWRIITSQIVHLSMNHALLNAMGFLIVSLAFRQDVTARREAGVTLIGMMGVGFGVYLFNPEIGWYVGLSGAIYTLLVHHLLVGARRTPLIALGFLIFVVSKVVYEQLLSGPDRAIETFIGGAVAEDAHLYGVAVGLLVGAISLGLPGHKIRTQ